MPRTLVIGLTESGTRTTINEDTFTCGGRTYPDMITGSEEQTAGDNDDVQLYMVTRGVGGSGAGDLAGRIAQRVGHDMTDALVASGHRAMDIRRFADAFAADVHQRVIRNIAPRGDLRIGTACALVLLLHDQAYCVNVGATRIYLFRENRLRRLTQDDAHEILLGDRQLPAIPSPDTVLQLDIRPGDIFLLCTPGFSDGFDEETMERDLASPDAFAATIRQLQIDSRSADSTENGTLLGVKVRDLNVPLDVHPPKSVMPMSAPAPAPMPPEGPPPMPPKPKKKKSNVKTFLLSLLMGFLIGLAIFLIVWFIILR